MPAEHEVILELNLILLIPFMEALFSCIHLRKGQVVMLVVQKMWVVTRLPAPSVT
jgi:hypothetical protein